MHTPVVASSIYILPFKGRETGREGNILDQFLPLENVQTLRHPAQIDAPAVSAHLATDTASTELVGDGGLGVESELDPAALATSFKFPDA